MGELGCSRFAPSTICEYAAMRDQRPPFFVNLDTVVSHRYREIDWSATTLGSLESWPAILKSMVRLMLEAKDPMFIVWGPEYRQLYNDAYVSILQDRHPDALGAPMELAWSEIWADIAPLIKRTYRGEAFRFENAPFIIRRNGTQEQTWFNFSYTPIRDAEGDVGGLYCNLVETTSQLLVERARQQESERLTAMFDQSPSFMALLVGPEHVYKFANASYFDLVGQRDLIGKSIREALPEVADQQYFDALDRVYTSGQNFVGRKSKVILMRRAGEPLEERFVDFVFQPVRNHEGVISGIFVEGYDVTDHKLTEDSLKESERIAREAQQEACTQQNHIKALLDAAPVGIGFADLNGKILLSSSANRQLWGQHPMSPNVEAYAEWRAWWADGSCRQGQPVKPHEWALARALKGEVVTNDIVEIETFDDPPIRKTILLHACPVRNSEGVVTNGVVAQIDISAQVRTEAALRESQSRLRRLIDSNIVGIVEYHVNGVLKEANDAFLQMVGYTRDEFERDGLSWRGLTPPEWDAVDEEHLQELQANGRMENFVKEFIRKDGSRTTVFMGGANFEDSLSEGIAYMADISDMVAAERAVKESEAKFRTIANAMPQMVWSTLPDGFHDYYNEQWYDYTGVPVGSTDGDGWNGMFHPDDQEYAFQRWRHSLSTGEKYEIEYRLKHRSGEYRWVLGRALPVRDEHGQIIRWMGTCTDIHDHKLTQVALQESNKRKDNFLAMLAHELRNPLAPISTAAQLLRRASNNEKQILLSSDIITRQVKHMTELVNDLLDVSRVTRGLIQLQMVPVDMKTVVASAIEQARPLIDARNHRLNTKISRQCLNVSGDKVRLVQVLSNLLNNAAKYTPAGGEITVSLSREKSHVRVSVADSGIGIQSALLPHVFELFTQGERTPDRSQGGLGLGLALVKTIVEMHQGTVEAVSAGESRGSVFSIQIPLIENIVDIPDCDQSAYPLSSAPVRPLSILIVDDNVDAASTLSALLSASGHQVFIANHPHDAIACAHVESFDALILDLGLPDMNGFDLAKRLRAIPNTRAALYVALSGYGQTQDRVLTAEAGFDHHLVKPVSFEQLVAVLAIATEERERRHAPVG